MNTPRTPHDVPTGGLLRERGRLWLVWAAVVAICGVGLANYRIDNDIERWMPSLASSGASGFVIVGFERDNAEAARWGERLMAEKNVAATEFIEGDGAWDGLLVFADEGVRDAELLRTVESVLGQAREGVALAGPPVFRAALDDWSQRGLPLASGLILLIGGVVMAVTTRRGRPVVEAMIAVFSSQVALVGLISLTGTPMDMVLSMTPPLLMGLGFSFAAHRATRPGVGGVLLMSMVTTAVSLGLFYFTDFAPIRSFALWGAVGMAMTWCAVMLLVTPAADRHTADETQHAVPMRRSVAWVIVAVGAAVTLGGAAALPGLSLQENTLDYFPPSARVVRDYQRIDAELTGTLPFEVVISRADADPTERVWQTPGVRRFERVASDVVTGETHYLGFASHDAMPALAAAQRGWHAWAHLHDTELIWRGVAAQVDHIARAVWRTACWALPTMLVVAGLAGWIVDRRASSFFLSLWINAFPVAVLGLWLGLNGKPVGLPSLLISALAVGVAIDDTLHLLVARRETGTFARAVAACRRPCVGSSLAAALCMLTFLLCPFRPTAEFGVLVAVTVIAALVGDLLLLPAAARLAVAGESS